MLFYTGVEIGGLVRNTEFIKKLTDIAAVVVGFEAVDFIHFGGIARIGAGGKLSQIWRGDLAIAVSQSCR